MSPTKEAVGEILRTLPDDATIEDVMYRLYVRSQIDHALEQDERDEVVEHEEIERKMAKWLEE